MDLAGHGTPAGIGKSAAQSLREAYPGKRPRGSRGHDMSSQLSVALRTNDQSLNYKLPHCLWKTQN